MSAGVRLFSDDDMVLLRSKNAAALERVTGVAMRLSGIREDDIDALAEEMLENPTVASPSPLARELGMTRQMLLDNMSSREQTEWMAYADKVEALEAEAGNKRLST